MGLIYLSGKLKGFEIGKDYSDNIVSKEKRWIDNYWGDMPSYNRVEVNNINDATCVKIIIHECVRLVSLKHFKIT